MTDKALVKQFVERSNLQGALAVTRDWAFVLGAAALAEWADHWAATALAVVWIAWVQLAIGEALLHEASHRNLFATRRLNDGLEFLYGLPFFTTVEAWRVEHLAHHAKLGKDGDHIVEDYEHYGLRDGANIWWVLLGRPLVGLVAVDYVVSLFAINDRSAWLRVAGFWTVVAAGLAAAGGLDELALYWLLPQLFGFSTWLYWSEVTDHFRTRQGTRSRTGRLNNWMAHNNGFHALHHTYASIPFYRLPEAHAALMPKTAETYPSMLAAWAAMARDEEEAPMRWRAFWPRAEEQGATQGA